MKTLLNLRRAYEMLEGHLERLSDVFYDELMSRPHIRGKFADAAQIERSKQTLAIWARELLTYPRDDASLVVGGAGGYCDSST